MEPSREAIDYEIQDRLDELNRLADEAMATAEAALALADMVIEELTEWH